MKPVFNKKQTALATVSEYRTPPFPVSKNCGKGVRETHWGSIEIVENGGATSISRNVLDAILTKAIKKEFEIVSNTGDIQMNILYDSKEVLDYLNTSADYSWLLKKIQELQRTLISIQRKDKTWPDSWSLISYSGETKIDAKRRSGQFGGKLKKIVLSPGAVKWLLEDVSIVVDEEVCNKIMLLKSELSKSVVKFFITHIKDQNHTVLSVLNAVGCNTDTKKEIDRRIAQLKEDEENLEELGITRIGDKIKSKRLSGVRFEKMTIKSLSDLL